MKLKDLDRGDLFQFKRQGHPALYESLGEGRYRLAGSFVKGFPHALAYSKRGTEFPEPLPDKAVKKLWHDEQADPENHPSRKICPSCGGTGRRATVKSAISSSELARHDRRGTRCSECKGTGTIPEQPEARR